MWKPATYLAKFVWKAINEVIVSAHKVMGYIKEIAKLYSQEGKPFEWFTPTGLLVRQSYSNTKKLRIWTHLSGSVVKLNYRQPLEKTIDVRKSVSGASPNFVHSLDAAALTLTVDKCLKEGITDFAMVHDSYGTHCTNMPKLNEKLREAFVEMYRDNDVLLNLYDSAVSTLQEDTDIPKPPERGSLAIEEVLNSDYFFA